MQKNKSMIASDTWLTPRNYYDKLNERFKFDQFDPCPQNCNLNIFNGLHVDWADRTFCNPPYNRGDKEAFINKAYLESLQGKLVVMLLPVSTSSAIFHDVIQPFAKVEFIKGRLKFEGIDNDGWWCNPHTGREPLAGTHPRMNQRDRAGQNDSMLVIFGRE